MLAYYTRIGGSQSADFYFVISGGNTVSGISCVIMGCVKATSADLTSPILMKHSSALS